MNEKCNICFFVPTFKRPVGLSRCLSSIISEAKSCLIEPQIYVSNNAPEDQDTKKIVNVFKEVYSNIVYEENTENLGIDLNMRKAFFIDTDSTYCIMLGDDNALRYGALRLIIENIRLKEYAFVVLGRYTVDTAKIKTKTCEYTNMRKAFRDLESKTAFGTIIVNLNLIKLLEKEAIDRFIGTYHIYSGPLWDLTILYPKVLYIDSPIIYEDSLECKSYKSYLDDVYMRAIPQYFNLIHQEYRYEALKMKNKFLLFLYLGSAENERQCMLEKCEDMRTLLKKKRFRLMVLLYDVFKLLKDFCDLKKYDS